MTAILGPFKKVLHHKFSQSPYTKAGQGQNIYTLECGHEVFAKTGIPVARKKRCRECRP